MKPIRMILYSLIFMCFVFCSRAEACTIWAATGETVLNGGSIIAKNRDNLSSTYSMIKSFFPEKGIPFYGIFDIEADGYVTAGINVKGVTVVNASPNSVPKKKRHIATEDLTEKLLKGFDSVDAMLADTKLFQHSHPAIYIIGDSRKIASVEIAPGGEVAITVKEKGYLALTNHYTDKKLIHANERLSRNSTLRLRHISSLLENGKTPFTMNDFILLSQEKDEGSDRALWRVQTPGRSIRTLASWVVYIPPADTPRLYIKLANPDEPEMSTTSTLDDKFWKQCKENVVTSFKQNSSR